MKKMTTWMTGVSAALLAFAIAAPEASAQQQKAPAAQPAPAAKAPAKAAKKPASQCKGLAEAGCKGTAGCTWRAERTVKKGERKGKKIAAHCRLDTPPPKGKGKAKAAAGAPASTPASTPAKAPAKAATPPPSSAGSAPKK